MIYFIIPALLLVWAMSPFCIREDVKAGKTALGATYPKRSIGGNNPASQRVHEGGGFRFGALLTVLVQAAIGAGAWLSGGDILPFAIAAQIAALWGVFVLLARWIDIGEHQAEALHGDSVTLHPDAQGWLDERGLETYRDGELLRLTGQFQDTTFATVADADAALSKAKWRARFITLLARW